MAKHKKQRQGYLNPARDIKNGFKYFNDGDYSHAIELWEIHLGNPQLYEANKQRITPALAEAYFRLGQRHLHESPTISCQHLEAAAKLIHEDALYAYHVGLGWHRFGETGKAITWYRESLNRDPGFSRSYLPLAIALVENGDDVTADPIWQKLDENSKQYLTHQPAKDTLSQALHITQQDKWDAAERGFKKAAENDTSGIADYYLGVIALRRDDPAQAAASWAKAFDKGLETPRLKSNLLLAYTLRAEALLSTDQIDDALNLVETGLLIDASNPRLLDMQSTILLKKGCEQAEKGNWEAALSDWQQIGDVSGTNARALAANMAIAYEKLENWQQAADAWREFARRRPMKEDSEGWLSPEQVALLWARVSTLYARAGLLEDAAATLKTALNHQPDDVLLQLNLARIYAQDERFEAAENQVDRILKKHPKHIETLVLNAELAEAAPGWAWSRYQPAIRAWKAVLDTGDEAYSPLARQRLAELYEESADDKLGWMFDISSALSDLETALSYTPKNHLLRARYVRVGLAYDQDRAKLQSHLDQIDLTDWDALHQLIDAWHTAEEHDEARALLNKAEQIKPLDATFFIGVATCAIDREQEAIAKTYIDEAIKRTPNDERQLDITVQIAALYIDMDNPGEGERLLRKVLREDPRYGPAHRSMANFKIRQGDIKSASDHLRKAEKWARNANLPDLAQEARIIRDMINSPMGLPPFLQNPGGFLPEAFASMFDDDEDFFDEFFDEDEFDEEDEKDEPHKPSEPVSDSRRRRKRKRGGRS
jgi:tetratricopeptide (TPR) repeat protein